MIGWSPRVFSAGGIYAVLVMLFLSFVPMLIYAPFLWWLDRFEKEPLPSCLRLHLGTVPAILIALIAEIILDVPISALAGSAFTRFPRQRRRCTTAPEMAKACGTHSFIFIRREFAARWMA